MKTIEENRKEVKDILQKLINKAWEDTSFKKQFIQNPEATIAEIAGKPFSSDLKIEVVDQTNPNIVYINLPSKPNLDELELTEKQLEAVAGGVCSFFYAIGHYAATALKTEQTVMTGLINAQACE